MSDNLPVTTSLELELGTQETPTLEFKRDARDRNAVREAICALVNDLTGAGGGDLIIGVHADGTPDPTVDSSDMALLALAGIADEGRILPKPSIVVSFADYRGSRVIRIHVNASQSPPVRFDGVVWVRPGPLTRRASADDERVLAERRLSTHLPFDTRPAVGAVTSLSPS